MTANEQCNKCRDAFSSRANFCPECGRAVGGESVKACAAAGSQESEADSSFGLLNFVLTATVAGIAGGGITLDC